MCVVSLVLSLLTVAGLIVYSRLLSHITVRTGPPPLKKITFAYKFKQGPYRSCEQLFRESHSIGPKLSCIGVFYDEPKKVRRTLHNLLSHYNVLSTFLQPEVNLEIRQIYQG